MRISNEISSLSKRVGIEKAIEMYAAAGFDCVDYSMFTLRKGDEHPLMADDYLQTVQNHLQLAKDCGITFNQAHAPFPGYITTPKDYLLPPEVYNKMIRPRVERAIEVAGRLGCDQIVVHPIAFEGERARQLEWNLTTYRELGKIARDFGTRIAIENMWGRSKANTILPNVCSYGEDLAEMYDLLNDPDTFTVCLDLGHSGLVGDDAGHAIRYLGKRLGALHVHDNDFITDAHTLPFLGKMDWEDITSALKEIGYKGDFTLEVDKPISKIPLCCLPSALKYMADVAKSLASQCE